MKLNSIVKFTPTSAPDVTVAIRRGTVGLRNQFELDIQHLERTASEIRREIAALREKNQLKSLTDEESEARIDALPEAQQAAYLESLTALTRRFEREYAAPRMRKLLVHAIKSIKGLTFTDEDDAEFPVTPENLMDVAPEDIAMEICTQVEVVFGGLDWAQQKNSESPTISLAVVAPSQNDSNAGLAGNPASITSETAASTP